MSLPAYYLLFINVLAFLLFGIDKGKARRRARRIPERVLLGAALLGGSIGAVSGMLAFRHKTRHKKFTLGLPAILLLQLAAAWLLRRGQY